MTVRAEQGQLWKQAASGGRSQCRVEAAGLGDINVEPILLVTRGDRALLDRGLNSNRQSVIARGLFGGGAAHFEIVTASNGNFDLQSRFAGIGRGSSAVGNGIAKRIEEPQLRAEQRIGCRVDRGSRAKNRSR